MTTPHYLTVTDRGGAISVDFPITNAPTRISSAILHMDSAPTLPGSVSIYLLMGVGASGLFTTSITYASLMHTNEMMGKSDLIWLPGWQLWTPIGDIFRLVYANPSNLAYYIRMTVEEWN